MDFILEQHSNNQGSSICYFFKYKIQLFKITANMYIPCEGIYKYTSQTVLFSGLKKLNLMRIRFVYTHDIVWNDSVHYNLPWEFASYDSLSRLSIILWWDITINWDFKTRYFFL